MFNFLKCIMDPTINAKDANTRKINPTNEKYKK